MTKKYVFVLEDNDDLRELFVHILQEESYEVRAYSNATSFKESLKCQRPDVIIMDIMLPDGNGLEICAELKMSKMTRNILIILTSANLTPMDSNEVCLAEDFIAKPFDIDYFVKKVQRFA